MFAYLEFGMKLPTCTAFHRSGMPVLHREHYSGGYTPLQRGRRSELIAATRELAEGSRQFTSGMAYPAPAATPRRGYKPSMEEAESMQYEREELRRREG